MSATTESKSNLMSEPVYEGIGASTIKPEPDYVGMSAEPNYVGITALEQDPEYEPVTGYTRQEVRPPSPIYANTLAKTEPYYSQ